MLKVDFYKLDWENEGYVKCCSLTWDGSKFTGSPKGSPQLRNILESPINHIGGTHTAQDDPRGFMENLHKQFRGPRFYATKAYDPAKGDPEK